MITISATFTAEPLKHSLSFLLKKLGQDHEIVFSPYNQVFQQLLDSTSVLRRNRHGFNVLLLRLEDWSNVKKNIQREASEFIKAVRAAKDDSSGHFLVIFCPHSVSVRSEVGFHDKLCDLEDLVRPDLELAGITCVTSRELTTTYPILDLDNPRGDALAHIPYTAEGFAALGAIIARNIYRLKGVPRKVIALDCDQTLWKGICGEDGALGVEIDPPRSRLQEFMLQQRQSGKLLCICSRNNVEDAFEVFDRHPDMVLKREHLSAWQVNWGLKSENLRSLARELNLGLDSFIFVDDDPAVCLEVRENCPEVLTLQLPDEPSEIPRFLDHIWAFDSSMKTREDEQRAQLYAENAERERLRGQAPNLHDFIRGLGLKVEIAEMTPENVTRVSQLTQRTNQFNFTTIRRSEAEVRKLWKTNQFRFLTASVTDRFGDYGLVGLMIFKLTERTLKVDSFLLSCRALGRGVEHQMFAHLGAMAQQRHLGFVELPFRETVKNRPALEFALQLEAAEVVDADQGRTFRVPAASAASLTFDVAKHYECSKADPQPNPTAPSNSRVHNQDFMQRIATELFSAEKIAAEVRAQNERTRFVTGGEPVAPANDVESKLKAIWESVLQINPVGVEDNYFDLGGDSFLAVNMFVEIERQFDKTLPLATLLDAPTIRDLARLIETGPDSRPWSPLVPIQPLGHRPPLYCMHAAGGDVLFYRDLAKHLGPNQPLYGLQARGTDRKQTSHDQVEDMAGFYLDAIRAFQPEGPYYLGGSSFGGLVAFEMARQLEVAGQRVAFLGLFDTYGPGYPQRISWTYSPLAKVAGWIQRLRTVIESLKLLGRKERLAYVLAKAKKLRTKLIREYTWRKNEIAINYSARTGQPLPTDIQRNHKAIDRALRTYVAKPYQGKLTLFRASRQPSGIVADETLGWRGMARCGLEIYEVPGVHGAVTVDPYAKFLAEKLEYCLAKFTPPITTAPESNKVPEEVEAKRKDSLVRAPRESSQVVFSG